jgi:lysozyme
MGDSSHGAAAGPMRAAAPWASVVAMTLSRGIDVSARERGIRWSQVAADGIEFAFLKSSEGRNLVDPAFERNWTEAGASGLVVGAYHIARVGAGCRSALLDSADTEAGLFASMLERVGYAHDRHLPPVLDVEWDEQADDAGVGHFQILSWMSEFLRQIEVYAGRRPLVYHCPTFYLYRPDEPSLHVYPLWEADLCRPAGAPTPIPGWDWRFHQYRRDGRVSGIDSTVKLDVYRGDIDSLREFVATAEQPSRSCEHAAAVQQRREDDRTARIA